MYEFNSWELTLINWLYKKNIMAEHIATILFLFEREPIKWTRLL